MSARTTTAGLAMAALLTACGGSDDSSSDPDPAPAPPTSSAPAPTQTDAATTEAAPTNTPEDDLEQSYRTYTEAFLTGDGATAYDLLSERCRGLYPLSEFAAVSESAAELYGLVDYTINSVEIDGKRGTLDAEFPVEALNQGGGSDWVLEGGAWRSDKCD